jgi:hypothetical protein
MSTRKFIRATRQLLRQIGRMTRKTSKRLVNVLLRPLVGAGRKAIWSQSGFVLPTTVLLVLVVTLTVGAIGYRTYTRSQQTIGERQQRQIYNAATPAIDRAKAKLEFLFDAQRDPRGGAVPGESALMGMMSNDGRTVNNVVIPEYTSGGKKLDPYTFPGETRVDINGDGTLDNAWRYAEDVNADGDTTDSDDATVAYSIIFTTPPASNTDTELILENQQLDKGVKKRANGLMVRNAPLSNAATISRCKRDNASGQRTSLQEEGWFDDTRNSTLIRKNFQVDAYVKPNRPDGAISTLEFQQDRQASKGFKWAAWFRNDLEIFPGPEFNLNGAVHTEGNMIVGGDKVRFYMISSPESCLYTKDASEITVTEMAAKPAVVPPIKAFTGQIAAGTIRDGNYAGTVKFDMWAGPQVKPTQAEEMKPGSDSINGTNLTPDKIAIDPVRLQTDDVAQYSDPTVQPDPAPTGIRDVAWATGNINKNGSGRVINKTQATPYVDDTFRADDRWGPKPRYGGKVVEQIGKDIPAGNPELINNTPPTGADETNVGLDGYWERRARIKGLRLIVGQRLELGDLSGWGGPIPDPDDGTVKTKQVAVSREPLRPWLGSRFYGGPASCKTDAGARCNEQRQNKALMDNLAAVQATAVYHAKNDFDFPVACLATTVHPGSAVTLDKSATFEDMMRRAGLTAANFDGFAGPIYSDFLRGYGTNGWEYPVPSKTNMEGFATGTTELGKALRNLAYFTGDPKGGTPSFDLAQVEEGADVVHPYPTMAMWGDFSMLRRIIQSGKIYDQLSVADKTAVHTASCTLSMLAYNVNYLASLKIDSINTGVLNQLASDLQDVTSVGRPSNNLDTPRQSKLPAAAYLPHDRIVTKADGKYGFVGKDGANDPEAVIRMLEVWRDRETASGTKRQLTEEIYLARLIAAREQVERDRLFGFAGDYGLATDDFNSTDATKQALSKRCTDWNALPDTDPKAPLKTLCSARPRYPILYSLFPVTNHGDAIGTTSSGTIKSSDVNATTSITGITAPTFLNSVPSFGEVRDAEDLVWEDGQRYLRKSTVNRTVEYQVVDAKAIAAQPGAVSTWKLKNLIKDDGNQKTPNSSQYNLIKFCADGLINDRPCYSYDVTAPTYRIPFKDAVLYNGRELLPVRTLDIDLELLRTTQTSGGDDYWLPLSGLVYAFREDAVSEAHIVRPHQIGGGWSNCDTTGKLLSATCMMRTFGNASSGNKISAWESTDPSMPLTGITPKPVDYYADPDRRPHGFRLKNGKRIWRMHEAGKNKGDNGLSFVTHNTAYVQGPFNLHQKVSEGTGGGDFDTIEEFQERLRDSTVGYGKFYDRKTLEPSFAKVDANTKQWLDQWRPTEILADAVTLLSENFCDGSIEDGFVQTGGSGTVGSGATSGYINSRYGCSKAGASTKWTSFHTRALPDIGSPLAGAPDKSLARSNVLERYLPSTAADFMKASATNLVPAEYPILVSRDGYSVEEKVDASKASLNPLFATTYTSLENGRTGQLTAKPTQMNMIMISGIVPSRKGQSYGGLHNFPRFIEQWGGGTDLFISGAMVQLNFSTYATAPFDQEQWQPAQAAPKEGANANEWIEYYNAPRRAWGYDVGLQFAPSGPVAERFKSIEKVRSEFYSEPRLNDPYISQLCRQVPGANCPT